MCRHVLACWPSIVDRTTKASPTRLALTAKACWSRRQEQHESYEQVLATVLDIVAAVTGESIGRTTPLMDAGVESMAAAEFVEKLNGRTGLTITPAVMFEHPTAEAVATHAARLLGLLAREADVVVAQTERMGGYASGLAMGPCTQRWPGGCRQGSGVTNAAFGRLLEAGGDALVQGVPAQRWTLSEAVDVRTLSERQLKCIQHGGYVDAERFDDSFFGISKAEVVWMDPHQRLLLEVGYESLHASGYKKTRLLGSGVGHFLGMSKADWSRFKWFERGGYANYSVYATSCDSNTVASGRLSFMLGLHGPCQTVDTACSSALVAMQNAALMIQSVAKTRVLTPQLLPHQHHKRPPSYS